MAQVYWSNNWVSSLWKDIAETQDSFLIKNLQTLVVVKDQLINSCSLLFQNESPRKSDWLAVSQEILEPQIPPKTKEPPAAVSCLDGKTTEIGCVMACFRGKNTEGFSEEIGNTRLDGWRDIRPSEYGNSLIFVDAVQYDEDTVHLKSNWQATVHDRWSQVSCGLFSFFMFVRR